MTDGAWGSSGNSPMNEGSENTAVGPGSVGEQRAGEDETSQGRRENKGSAKQPWGKDEERHGETAEQGGQPNLSPDPPVAGRPTQLSPGASDDSPGTPLGDSGAKLGDNA
jgi:hypothetical protein